MCSPPRFETKTIRNIFTLGIGELFDWGSLNIEIEKAGKLVTDTENRQAQCERDLGSAKSDVWRVENDISQLNALQNKINSDNTSLDREACSVGQLMDNVLALQNVAGVTSQHLCAIDGMASVLFVKRTAAQIEESVAEIQGLAMKFERAVGDIYPVGSLRIAPESPNIFKRSVGWVSRRLLRH